MMRMPVVFSGHGDPMIALREDDITRGMAEVGRKIRENYGKPKAILAISAHWYTNGTYIQTEEVPEQIYDMYGFPQELYDLKYPVDGCGELTTRVQQLLGDRVSANDRWGIDHGSWSVLVHMFPEADIPVVQLSVDGSLSHREIRGIGQKLALLREEGYLIFGSGNVVHNLGRVEWDNPNGTEMTQQFNEQIVDAIQRGDMDTVMNYEQLADAAYAVPTPEHYLPLIYCMAAADGDPAAVFNNVCNLGSMAMTGFCWG